MASSAVRFRDLLTAAHIDHFLPMTKKVVTRSGKEETVETPLLFSYIFVRSDELTINDFCRIIESKDRGQAGTSAPAKALFLEKIEYPYDF